MVSMGMSCVSALFDCTQYVGFFGALLSTAQHVSVFASDDCNSSVLHVFENDASQGGRGQLRLGVVNKDKGLGFVLVKSVPQHP